VPLHSSSGSYATIQNKFKYSYARNTKALGEREHCGAGAGGIDLLIGAV